MAEQHGQDEDEEDENAMEGGASDGPGCCEGEVFRLSVDALHGGVTLIS